MSGVGCSLEVGLACCLSAKNLLLNSCGYSPNQLVFGYHPNFPSVMQSKPPALEGVITSKSIALHLNALHSARKRFIESEAFQKLHRVLRHKTRSDSGYWKGPGTVIGHDNKQVFVRHRGIYVHVSPCHLQLLSESEKAENVGTKELKSDFKKGTEIAVPEKKYEISCNTNIDHTTDDMCGVIKNGTNKSCPEVEQPTENDVSTLSDILDQLELGENDCEHRNPTQITCTVPSLKSKVRYQDPDTNVWRKALVISRAGKVSGKNKNWFNVKHLDDDTMKSVNFEAIPGWENLNEEVLLCKGGTFEVAEAKLKELQNWRINKVYDEVDDEKQSSISVRWVLTEKLIEEKTQVKARLVARGFEDAG